MTNPYEVPQAVLKSEALPLRKKTGWKIFFWIFMPLACLSFWFVIADAESSNIDKLGEVIVYSLIGVGLFGFAYNKKIFAMRFWRGLIPVAIGWDIYTLVNQDWTLFSKNDMAAYIIIGITLTCLGLMLFFQYFGLYQYAYQSREIWVK
ncbi:MAG: hypothetical protein U1B30_06660 [Pseudomonadota bacterium]|nr:hypothetical protein [Pseudomonadota bacterium]